jgi:hypothetical protein
MHARRPKDAAELARLRAACGASARAYAAIAPRIRAGVTERELQIELEAEFFRGGGDRTGYGSIVGAGAALGRAALRARRARRARGRRRAHRRRRRDPALHLGRDAHVPRARRRSRLLPRAVRGGAGAAGTRRGALPRGRRVARRAHGRVPRHRGGPRGAGHHARRSRRARGARRARALLPARARPHGRARRARRERLPARAGAQHTGRGSTCCAPTCRCERDYVITVEPGVYFIPALLRDPARRKRYADCVAWDRVDQPARVWRHPHRGQRADHRTAIPRTSPRRSRRRSSPR